MKHWLGIIGAGLMSISIHPVDSFRYWLLFMGILMVAETIILFVGKDIDEIKNELQELRTKMYILVDTGARYFRGGQASLGMRRPAPSLPG